MRAMAALGTTIWQEEERACFDVTALVAFSRSPFPLAHPSMFTGVCADSNLRCSSAAWIDRRSKAPNP